VFISTKLRSHSFFKPGKLSGSTTNLGIEVLDFLLVFGFCMVSPFRIIGRGKGVSACVFPAVQDGRGVVQELLGHASISLTLDTYSKVLPGLKERVKRLHGFLLGNRRED